MLQSVVLIGIRQSLHPDPHPEFWPRLTLGLVVVIAFAWVLDRFMKATRSRPT
jgi:hypothetical protein